MLEENPSEILNLCKHIAAKRKDLGLPLSKVSSALKIRSAYLKAIESGDLSKIPPGMYANAYIKNYARFLGINYNEPDQPEIKSSLNVTRNIDALNNLTPSKKLVYICITLVILVNIIYWLSSQ